MIGGADGQEHFLNHPRPTFPEPPNGFHPSKINLNRMSHSNLENSVD
jgi:hypothetical protein